MMFWQIARDLTRRLPEWDASAKLSLAIALPLLLFLLALGFFGPSGIQFPARVGAFGLLVTIQLLFLWANRRHASPYHQAQRHFVAGDHQAARALLEALPDRGRASADALILLGNTYRNLGQFDQCEKALTRALEIKPESHLALFSLGKLRLVQGEYRAACDCFERAIQAGAPQIIRFEWGQALFMLGDYYEASEQMLDALPAIAQDPAQMLLVQHYHHRLGAGSQPDAEFIAEQLPFWRDEAAKYAETPYGAHLSEVARELEATLKRGS